MIDRGSLRGTEIERRKQHVGGGSSYFLDMIGGREEGGEGNGEDKEDNIFFHLKKKPKMEITRQAHKGDNYTSPQGRQPDKPTKETTRQAHGHKGRHAATG